MPDQETRIRQAAEALRKRGFTNHANEMAVVALEAADAPPKPKWPSDASADELGYKRGADLSQLRAALLADPIIQSAITLRDSGLADGPCSQAVADAVTEAGL